jgi:hypothetical protein
VKGATVQTLRMIGNELRAISDSIFRRPPAVDDAATLADFIDQQAAFLIQKGIYEYARARAGHYAKVLFREQPFVDAVERSRWCGYPIGLAMVGELVEGVLRPPAGDAAGRQLDALCALVLSVFDRYPVPAALGQSQWSDARAELARRMQRVGLHPPKRAFEIADPYLKAYFDLMPINEWLRRTELGTIHGYLKATLCNVHAELTKRMDAQAVVAALLESGERDARAP